MFVFCRNLTDNRFLRKAVSKSFLICLRCISTGSPCNIKTLQYLLILDFEATCEENKQITQEIIEFPCLKINIKTCKEEARFHHYVKPQIYKELPIFCIELTGILQEMVNDGKDFHETFQMYEDWRRVQNLTDENSICLTSGDWDLGFMLPSQCKLSNTHVPSHMLQWINIKKVYAKTTGVFPKSLRSMLKDLNLEFKGRQHSGIDDCLNIFQITQELRKKGAVFTSTSQLSMTPNGPRVVVPTP